jgi:hypothetical protein
MAWPSERQIVQDRVTEEARVQTGQRADDDAHLRPRQRLPARRGPGQRSLQAVAHVSHQERPAVTVPGARHRRARDLWRESIEDAVLPQQAFAALDIIQ